MFDRFQLLKTFLLVSAVLIAGFSLLFSQKMTRDLFDDEVAKMGVWAEAMRQLTEADETTDLNLVLKIINSNNTIPVVVYDDRGNLLATRNLPAIPAGKDSIAFVEREARRIKAEGNRMEMELTTEGGRTDGNPERLWVYYEESVMLHRLGVYPYVQLTVVTIFILIAIFALLASKRAEQNRVWAGLSRETAHQLGTPISSLMAWSEVLRETYPNDPLLPEMDKDIRRLELIAERFSKIGSEPELEVQDLRDVIARVVEYFDRRTSKKVVFTVNNPPHPLPARLNAPLFEWVIENLAKNAVDAMEGHGSITVTLTAVPSGAHIEVMDTGKGIPRNRFKTVFQPGFTTKKRGWGLGLSLAKRIVEEYHHGHIYVKSSEQGHGTTFAIDLG